MMSARGWQFPLSFPDSLASTGSRVTFRFGESEMGLGTVQS
jgi:hypothetical protein